MGFPHLVDIVLNLDEFLFKHFTNFVICQSVHDIEHGYSAMIVTMAISLHKKCYNLQLNCNKLFCYVTNLGVEIEVAQSQDHFEFNLDGFQFPLFFVLLDFGRHDFAIEGGATSHVRVHAEAKRGSHDQSYQKELLEHDARSD